MGAWNKQGGWWLEQSEYVGMPGKAGNVGQGKLSTDHRSVPKKDLGFDSEVQEATVGMRVVTVRVCRRARMILI